MSQCHAFIQARMSSSRFPGKVLEPIAGLPAIVYMAKRASKARLLDSVMVVTSTDSSDDPLVASLSSHGIPSFRGALNDVLGRFGSAAMTTGAEEIVRLTGDCPLVDPNVIDAVIRLRRDSNADYASNVDPPSFPDGLDCEVFTRQALQRALDEAQLPVEREHVTLWMRSDAAALVRTNFRSLFDASSLRLTVDYPDDLEAVRDLVASLPDDGSFDLYDILRAMADRQEVFGTIRHVRNEALLKLNSMNI